MSYFKVLSSVVEEQANAKIALMNKLLEDYRQNLFDKRKNELIKSWWRKLRRLPMPTDNEIIEQLKNEDTPYERSNAYNRIDYFYLEEIEVAVKLLAACKQSSEIIISINDWKMIGTKRKYVL